MREAWAGRGLVAPDEEHAVIRSPGATCTLDASGYARFRHWRVYGEEGLARCEVAVWLGAESLTAEYAGETLSRYEVEYDSSSGKLKEVASPRLFESSHRIPLAQLRLLELDMLGEDGWLKAPEMEANAAQRRRMPVDLQQSLFSSAKAI
jgi:hypothetical protein